jgi:DNA-directed RNA polymerase specialized sigma24 family protein
MAPSDHDRWDLTPRAFVHLLERLSTDRAVAATEYESLRRRLADYFDWRGCPNPDVYADETLDRVARKLREGEKVDNVHKYVFGVARMLLLESVRRREREKVAHAEWRPLDVVDDPVDEDQVRCLESCMKQLPEETRELLIRYYQGDGRTTLAARKELAVGLGINSGALKVRAHRARATLEACLRKCLHQKKKGGRR